MARARAIRTETIVLRQQVFGEADRLLTLLTPDRGKLRAIAKGVRRPSSRKAGHLDVFMRADVLLAIGRNLDIISQAQTLDPYRALREDLLRFSYASYCVELLHRFTPDGETNHELYHMLADTLSRLCGSDKVALVARHYELHLLDLVGFRPELERCLGKGEPVQPEDQHFDPLAGGVLCLAALGLVDPTGNYRPIVDFCPNDCSQSQYCVVVTIAGQVSFDFIFL